MKHIMTFENYSSVNEEFLDLGKIYNKLKDKLSAWKDQRTKAAAEKMNAAIDKVKDKPEFKEALGKFKTEFSKLGNEDQAKIAEFSTGEVPVVKEAEVSESISDVIDKALKILGLSTGAFGLIMAVFTLLKITGAIAGALVFGMPIATAIGVFAGLMALGGIVSGVGFVRAGAKEDKIKGDEAMARYNKSRGM